MQKPSDLFDREFEWDAILRFLADERPGATLGVVSGRRRMGKTTLLDAASRALGGFYFAATEATESESLTRIGEALTTHLASPAPIRPRSWEEVVPLLMAIGRDRPTPVVLDEFPYLVRASPALPSILQAAYGPLDPVRRSSKSRLLLCGSALSFMGRLLGGTAPLRGRAGLELVVRPLDYRLAASFWGLTDPHLAIRVHAIVGGTPAYRREFTRNDSPVDAADFDNWVTRAVLSPDMPLFREGRYLLAEEADLRDTGLYHSVLAAIASGSTSRGAIAGKVGRQAADIAHPLHVLEDAGLVARDVDVFRDNRTWYRIAEPLLAFHHAVMRPVWDQLERPGAARRVWAASRSRFDAQILGPHFEGLCRLWAGTFAGGEIASRVGAGTVHDVSGRATHQVDVAVVGVADSGRPPLLSIGEAKWGETMGLGHLQRLEKIRGLLSNGRYDTSGTSLVCYGAAGFSATLEEAARNGRCVLVSAGDLYG